MADTPENYAHHFEQTVLELHEHSQRMRRTAIWVGVAGVLIVGAAAYYGARSTSNGAALLTASNFNTGMLVYELVRIAAGAALLGAAAWGFLNLSRAALDQSTRYEKRLIAGHFLVYVVRKFETQIKAGDIELKDVMGVFTAWSDSVDSAFTNVKFGSKSNQGLALRIDKNGVSAATAGADLPVVENKGP